MESVVFHPLFLYYVITKKLKVMSDSNLPLFFKTPEELKQWFKIHSSQHEFVFIGFYKKSSKKPSITWEESVFEAVAVGWIDGVRKSIDKEAYQIRFTPRKKNSIWSLKNISIAEQLIKEGRMKEAGLKAYQLRKESKTGVYAFEQKKVSFSKEFENEFKANEKAWKFFTSLAPSYQKKATHWVMSAKQEKTRIKRLNTLIEDASNHLKLKQHRY